MMTRPTERVESRAAATLVVVGIAALGFNLRPAAVSVGPVLREVSLGLEMSPSSTSLLTTLPVIAFAVFGAAAPLLARRLGAHRVTLLALGAVVVGLGARALTGSVLVFLATSLLALAGMATANVLLPSLVKLHFPTRVGLMTSVYTTSMAVGLTAASALTVPFARRFADGGWGWRGGLALWALPALLAALPWLGLLRHDARPAEPGRRIGLRDVARTRLGWAMAALFGLQSLQAYSIFGWFAQVYRDAGFSAEVAGVLLGVITGMSIPLSLSIPAKAARMANQGPLLIGLMACYPVGYLGLMVAPAEGALLWAVIVGVGSAVFPLALTLIGLRARTSAGTAALSGFTQAAGYLIAVVGPFGVGLLYDLTGGWHVPLTALLLLTIPQLLAGLRVTRPGYIEDELAVRDAAG